MKKKYFTNLTALLLVLGMLLSMVGCANSSTEPSVVASSESSSVETGTTASAAETTENDTTVANEMPPEFEPNFELFDSEGNLLRVGRDAVGDNGIVTSGRIEASRAGLEIIMAGGNAVDAAVATSFALAVCEPAASGVGGGGFMNIHLADGTSVFLDGREFAPMAATPDLWPVDAEGKVIDNVKTEGGKAVCVPTHVATLLYALDNYGTMTREEVMAPAIRLAEEGFDVSPNFASDSETTMGKLKQYNNGEAATVFLSPSGFPYAVGDTLKNPNMANTLKTIAEKGLEGFYKGEIAQAIVDAVQESGGVMELSDLEKAMNTQPIVRYPVQGTYRDYQIIAPAPVSSGGTHVVEILNIIENFDISSYDVNSAEYMHLFSEAFKMAFADRAKYMGDPAFVEGGLPIPGLINKDYAKELAAQIDLTKSGTYEAGNPWDYMTEEEVEGAVYGMVIGENTPDTYESTETTHFSIGDKDGNMVSMTQTVNGYFGSGVMPTGTGFILNNQCSDFGIGWGLPNSVEGGKKPLSSMSPTIVLTPEGNPFLIVGSPGGTRIFPTVAQVIVKAIDYKMPVQEMIDSPRIWDSNQANVLYEDAISQEEIDKLVEMGHEVTDTPEWSRALGSVNAVLYGEDGKLYGGADPRRDGKALGY